MKLEDLKVGQFEEIVIFENEIKSIVTHEQMEQMSYKVNNER